MSRGPELVVVPDVSGQSVQEAIAALEAAGLTVDGVVGNPSRPVLITDPLSGAQVPRGTVSHPVHAPVAAGRRWVPRSTAASPSSPVPGAGSGGPTPSCSPPRAPASSSTTSTPTSPRKRRPPFGPPAGRPSPARRLRRLGRRPHASSTRRRRRLRTPRRPRQQRRHPPRPGARQHGAARSGTTWCASTCGVTSCRPGGPPTHWRERAQGRAPPSPPVSCTRRRRPGSLGNPGQTNYGAAKAGVAAFSAHRRRRSSAATACGRTASCRRPAPASPRRCPGSATWWRHPSDDRFDVWDPANVSPLVAYLATADCPFSGAHVLRAGWIGPDLRALAPRRRRRTGRAVGVSRTSPLPSTPLAENLTGTE